MLMLAHFWVVISAPKFSECTQHKCVNAGAFFGCLVLRAIFKPAPNVNVLAFVSWFVLCPNFQSEPQVNVLILVHFVGGYFCAQIFRVHPR